MPELSEFITFIAERSGVEKTKLIEQDIVIHGILKRVYASTYFSENYVLKGGSCLVKCYFGYYRFSVDLDFTWRNKENWKVGVKELRRRLHEQIRTLSQLLEEIAEQTGLEFVNDPKNRKYFEFSGGGRMVTFKLWKGQELVKIQVNFLEELLFQPKTIIVKTLLDNTLISERDRVYFEEFLSTYRPFEVNAYDEREILCEKVRAILTRRAQKLRDFYDIFMLNERGYRIERFTEEIKRKIRSSLYYRRYRNNLEANKKTIEYSREVLEDPFERGLFVVDPPRNFDRFLEEILNLLKEIARAI